MFLPKCTFLDLSRMPTNLTRQQLALHNGQDKSTIYIAYQGIIYDVTHSRLWRNGQHYQHWAGQDLTAELADAPHTEQVFKGLTQVGRLV